MDFLCGSLSHQVEIIDGTELSDEELVQKNPMRVTQSNIEDMDDFFSTIGTSTESSICTVSTNGNNGISNNDLNSYHDCSSPFSLGGKANDQEELEYYNSTYHLPPLYPSSREKQTRKMSSPDLLSGDSSQPMPEYAALPTVVPVPPPKPRLSNFQTTSASANSSAKYIYNSTKQLTSTITSMLPNPTSSVDVPSVLKDLTTRKYTLPDKCVASQVLMFRQLLHTTCKPGLRLSRKFQRTAAQLAVMHMPWWEQNIEETGRMVISYDNLIVRLWMNGSILPYNVPSLNDDNDFVDDDFGTKKMVTLIDDQGLPPVPHINWVERLGFQQEDPVTDFRSGGVLSLAMIVHIVESCPRVHARFLAPDTETSLPAVRGDASVLPYALTSINITDMLAKFLMFSKSVDKIDALLSSKPFWKMFGDPNALLVLQELSMDMLCDVVVEINQVKSAKTEADENIEELSQVTVFDFPQVMEITEKRVRDDLLGAGPKTVDDMRAIHGKLQIRYKKACDKRVCQILKKKKGAAAGGGIETNDQFIPTNPAAALDKMVNAGDKATEAFTAVAGSAGGFFRQLGTSSKKFADGMESKFRAGISPIHTKDVYNNS